MRSNHYVLLTALFAMTLTGCSKSDDNVTPTVNTTDLLTRKWTFSETNVKTDAKTYTPPSAIPLLSDDNTVTFSKGGTFSYLSDAKLATGKWTLTDKTLVLTDADNTTLNWTVNTLNSTDLELGSINVNITKGKDLTDSRIYTSEEQNIGIASLLLLSSLDKQNGGTIDFTKEAQPKSLQLILKGKGQ